MFTAFAPTTLRHKVACFTRHADVSHGARVAYLASGVRRSQRLLQILDQVFNRLDPH